MPDCARLCRGCCPATRLLRLLLVYFLLLLWPSQSSAQEALLGFDAAPLQPADTSSPRDTLRSFDDGITAAMRAWRDGQPLPKVIGPGRRALETIDFSLLAERGRFAREIETALLLKEVLDRIKLPPVDEIPGADAVNNKDDPLTRWTVPQTRIAIARVEGGPQAGEFLFTADTISRLDDYYAAAKHMPYKPGALVGIYEDYAHSSGLILPRSWTNAFPDWSRTLIFDEALWQWLGLVLIVGTAVFAVRRLLRWGQRWDDRHLSDRVRKRFGLPVAILAAILLVYLLRFVSLYVLGLISDAWTPLSTLVWLVIFGGAGWFIVLMTDRIADVVNDVRETRAGSIDSQLVRIVLRLVSLIILVLLVVYAANFFGIPLTPVIASLGVGGLAIALAVRPTLENIIGGLTLFADKPVRIGDFCRFGNEDATVEQIGLRSTRLRKVDDTLVSVPNSDFSQRELTNYTRRRRRLYQMTIGLRYETTADQLHDVVGRIEEMLRDHPKALRDKLHVRFDSYGAYSLDIAVFVYVKATDWLEYLAIREDINFTIMTIVQKAGVAFAFPSQTVYLAGDASGEPDPVMRPTGAAGSTQGAGSRPVRDGLPSAETRSSDDRRG